MNLQNDGETLRIILLSALQLQRHFIGARNLILPKVNYCDLRGPALAKWSFHRKAVAPKSS